MLVVDSDSHITSTIGHIVERDLEAACTFGMFNNGSPSKNKQMLRTIGNSFKDKPNQSMIKDTRESPLIETTSEKGLKEKLSNVSPTLMIDSCPTNVLYLKNRAIQKQAELNQEQKVSNEKKPTTKLPPTIKRPKRMNSSLNNLEKVFLV
jgi:hypothetical protein